MVTKFLNTDTDNTLSANSNERVPSQKAVKTYTDNLTTAKQNKVLDTPITVGSTEETTVEGALGAINTSLSNKQNQSLSSAITVDGTQQTTVEGALNALNIYANSKQNNLTAGNNITISSNVISAKDTTYVAGTGISITEDSDDNLVISNTQTSAEWGNISGTLSNQTDLQTALSDKQDTLVSGTNIKTVNNNSLLGSGNLDIDALPTQTGQSGKFLTTDGTDASWSDKPLVNTATYPDSGMVIGGSDTGYPSLVAVGKSSKATLGGTAVGNLADAGMYGIAIGYNAKTTGSYAIQLNCSTGNQTNADANTFKVANQNGNYELMSADGTIPVGRLNTMTGADGANAGAKGVVPAPAATDNTKFLKGDGTWAAVDALPSQTGQSGKFLTTDGSAASWAEIPTEVDNKSVTLNSNDEIQTVGVIDQNDTTKAIKKWTGTKAEYDAIVTKDPDTEYITLDENETVYQNSYRIGQVLPSILPISDYGLHLLDGSVIDGTGIYSSFYSYIAGLVSTYPNLFISEADWQTVVTTYGVCGKFVYDSTNQTIRLPKITGIIEGTTDATALGDLVQAGLPNITGAFATGDGTYAVGAFYQSGTHAGNTTAGGANDQQILLDASRSSAIYGNSTTVQPQTIKVYYYIVIANSYQTPTGVQISKVATDLNGKVNLNSSWGMPTGQYIDLTLGASGTAYTAPADGYYAIDKKAGVSGVFLDINNTTSHIRITAQATDAGNWQRVFVPARKGDIVEVTYNSTGTTNMFRFIYAQKDNN